MDIIDYLSGDHRRLREALGKLSALLGDPCDEGWADCQSLEKSILTETVRKLLSAFEKHEELEKRFLSPLLRQLETHADLAAIISEGHHELQQTMRLLDAVAGICDGKHVYRVRTMLFRLRDEMSRHLTYEEESVFPKLRERLPAGLLHELGRRASQESTEAQSVY